jgi:hypothetical protein
MADWPTRSDYIREPDRHLEWQRYTGNLEREPKEDRMSNAERLSSDLDTLLNDLTCEDATALLRAYELRRRVETEATKAKDAVAAPLRRHFDSCPERYHTDGEHGLEGGLRRQEFSDFDLIQMATQSPQDVISLALRGCLSVNVTQAKGLKGRDPAVDRLWDRFHLPRERVSLYVERKR